MTEGRRLRRRRRGNSSETQNDSFSTSQVREPTIADEETNNAFATKLANGRSSLLNPLDGIRAEIADEKRLALAESTYWDDTHNWGDDASDEYWSFLGGWE